MDEIENCLSFSVMIFISYLKYEKNLFFNRSKFFKYDKESVTESLNINCFYRPSIKKELLQRFRTLLYVVSI